MPASSRAVAFLCRVVLAGASQVVPSRLRSEWRREWEAEVWYRLQTLQDTGALGPASQLDLVTRCVGAWRHAGWLLVRQVRATAPVRESTLALRLLGRTPVAAGLVVVSLGLGIGVVGTTFALVHAAVLRPLPYHEAARLTTIYNRARAAGLPRIPLSDLEFLTMRRESRALATMAAFRAATFRLEGPAGGRLLRAASVTSDFFGMVRPPPALGRWLTAADFTDATPRVVLSHVLWDSWFGRDPSVVGRVVRLDGAAALVIGVAPPGFAQPLDGTELWAPLRVGTPLQPGVRSLRVIAVRRSNASVAQTAAELNRISAELQASHPQVYFGGFDARWEVALETPRPAGVRTEIASLLLLLVAASLTFVAVVGGIAGQAALLLRAPRTGYRRASSVGAASLAGGGLGLLLTFAGLEALRGVVPDWFPGIPELPFDWRAPAAAIAAGGFALLAFLGARGCPKPARTTYLAVAFAGLVVLATAATLATLTYGRIRSASPGYESTGLVAIPAGWRPDRYRSLGEMAARIAAEPGVEAVTVASTVPLATPAPAVTFDLEGREQRAGERPTSAELHLVGREYFALLGIPLESGREFRDPDGAVAADEIVVNRAMAGRFWPGERAVGRRIRVYLPRGPLTPWLTVVGVAGDVGNRSFGEEAAPAFYLPAAIDSTRLEVLLVRMREGSGAVTSPGTPAGPVAVSSLLARATVPRRNAALALDLMAGLALMSAAGAARLAGRANVGRAAVVVGIAAGAAVLWLARGRITEILALPVGPSVIAAATLGILVSVAAAGLAWLRSPARHQPS